MQTHADSQHAASPMRTCTAASSSATCVGERVVIQSERFLYSAAVQASGPSTSVKGSTLPCLLVAWWIGKVGSCEGRFGMALRQSSGGRGWRVGPRQRAGQNKRGCMRAESNPTCWGWCIRYFGRKCTKYASLCRQEASIHQKHLLEPTWRMSRSQPCL